MRKVPPCRGVFIHELLGDGGNVDEDLVAFGLPLHDDLLLQAMLQSHANSFVDGGVALTSPAGGPLDRERRSRGHPAHEHQGDCLWLHELRGGVQQGGLRNVDEVHELVGVDVRLQGSDGLAQGGQANWSVCHRGGWTDGFTKRMRDSNKNSYLFRTRAKTTNTTTYLIIVPRDTPRI